MNKTRTYITVLLILFALSFGLVAFDDGRGYDCFWFCAQVLISIPSEFSELGAWAYYGGFAITNLLFVACACRLVVKQVASRFLCALCLILSLHVASWALLNFRDLSDLKYGYYIWLGSYLGLSYLACLLYANRRSTST